MKVVLLNGAPRSGKDTLAEEILHVLESEGRSAAVMSVGHRLKDATHGFFAALQMVPVPEWNAFEACKDSRSSFFQGRTPREAYIRMHEDFIKPNYGQMFLASLVRGQLRNAPYDCVVVPDIGGEAEVIAFQGVDPVVVRVHRDDVRWDNRRAVSDAPNVIDYESTTEVNQIRLWIKRHLLGRIL